jgi:hypothetical protein
MKIPEIIEALEKAEGPSRGIDAEISMTALGMRMENKLADYPDEVPVFVVHDGNSSGSIEVMFPRFTSSVDAALALHERVLPGWFWRCGETPLFPKGWAYVSRTDASNCDKKDEAASSDGKAASPAIALCIATLKALQAKEPTP